MNTFLARGAQRPPDHGVTAAPRTGQPLRDILGFARLLRTRGSSVPTSSVLDAVRGLDLVDVTSPGAFRDALRCTLARTREDALRFDALFDQYWLNSREAVTEAVCVPGSSPSHSPPEGDALAAESERVPQPAGSHGLTVSHAEGYSKTGVRRGASEVPAWLNPDLDEAARRLARLLRGRRSIRMRSRWRGDVPDLRTVWRRNLSTGGEPVHIPRLVARPERGRVVAVCDVSSSMRAYTPLFLGFVHALANAVTGIDALIFNVTASVVTDVLREKQRAEAMEWLDRRSIGLGGGTQIGTALAEVNTMLAPRSPRRRQQALVLMLSDGWDVGDKELLRREAEHLRGQVRSLVWLSPYAEATGYQPNVQGLQACWPFIDAYLHLSDVASLHRVVDHVDGVLRQADSRSGVARAAVGSGRSEQRTL